MKIKDFLDRRLDFTTVLRQQGQAMIDEVRRERTLEFVLMCKCSGVFLFFINNVERKVRSKNADEIRLFGRKMQLVLGYMIDRFSQIH